MADYHLKGSTDNWEQSLRTDNGCTARQPGCARGPVDGAVAGHASEWDPRVVARRALAVYTAYRIGRERAPAAIVRATGLDDLPKLSKAVLSGMLQMALVVAATTAIGGLAGAAIGALFAGVGAAPGAAVGIDIGFNAGMAVLTWMGLAAIAIEVVRGIGEVTNLLQRGVVTAWEAEDAPNRQAEIDAAGELMAEAIGKLMLLVLLAIVARLTAAQAVASTERAAAASGELFAMLRRSRLGTEFAAWVEANAERLMRNPRLKLHRETTGASGKGESSSTPSQLKRTGAKSEAAPAKSSPSTPEKKAAKPLTHSRPEVPKDAYPDDMSAWKNADGTWKYPDNDGFLGERTKRSLEVGEKFDRFGSPAGRYASPAGTDFQARSLPPTSTTQKYYVYEVVKPLEVESGTIAPWFEQPGLGTQLRFEQTIQTYLREGYIKLIAGPL